MSIKIAVFYRNIIDFQDLQNECDYYNKLQLLIKLAISRSKDACKLYCTYKIIIAQTDILKIIKRLQILAKYNYIYKLLRLLILNK